MKIIKFIGYFLTGLGLGLGCTYGNKKIGTIGWFAAAAGFFILQFTGM